MPASARRSGIEGRARPEHAPVESHDGVALGAVVEIADERDGQRDERARTDALDEAQDEAPP